jgi:hypothetical protein
MLQIKNQIMKKVFLGLLVVASFAACTNADKKTTETAEATSEKVNLYRQF